MHIKVHLIKRNVFVLILLFLHLRVYSQNCDSLCFYLKNVNVRKADACFLVKLNRLNDSIPNDRSKDRLYQLLYPSIKKWINNIECISVADVGVVETYPATLCFRLKSEDKIYHLDYFFEKTFTSRNEFDTTEVVVTEDKNAPIPESSSYLFNAIPYHILSSSGIEKCSTSYLPVTGDDKRCYLNKCIAEKMGVKVLNEGCSIQNYVHQDVYTWPIKATCIAVDVEGDTRYSLNDQTLIYNERGRKYRGTKNTCRCLSVGTMISTPKGEKEVSLLNKGDTIWTTNQKGEKIAAAIILINRVKTETNHRMLHIELADGRTLQVTPEHPSADQHSFIDQFKIGEQLDGSVIIKKFYLLYQANYTYDILPGGTTGNYWANGIIIGSTLFNYYHLSDKSK